jgi:hypothetical protein
MEIENTGNLHMVQETERNPNIKLQPVGDQPDWFSTLVKTYLAVCLGVPFSGRAMTSRAVAQETKTRQ